MQKPTEYICIDADAHLTEAKDTWTSRVPAKFKNEVPVIRWVESQKQERWFMGDIALASVGMTACAGYSKPFPDFPATFDEAIPAAHDTKARLAYMDSAGIWAQVIYPNVAGFGGQEFLRLKDEELKLACVRAYNDFLVDWSSEDPRRFVINVALPFWDIGETIKEITRCAKLGFRGINFTAAPHEFGLPYMGDRHWEPLWSIAEELGFPISFHIGNGDMLALNFEQRCLVEGVAPTVARATASSFLMNGLQLNDLLFSGVLPRHPKIRFVSVESGIGWIPFVLEAADYQFEVNNVSKSCPEFKMKPSDYFRENVYACYWFEKNAPQQVLDIVGKNNIMFETDFPHPTCLYGNVAQTIQSGLGTFKADVRERILFGNAADLFHIEYPPAKPVN